MPGYRASEPSDGQDVAPAAQREVLTELPAHWGLEEPSIVTHDFGGAVALRGPLRVRPDEAEEDPAAALTAVLP
ncbi:hypothetical protein [Spirillospora sp. CA-128828]|uniref:hypothetical protein n=1 Tax=Spirillospora sp. CA-128828 TaxID=3240033 RepID=UPI003D8FC2BD